MAFSLIASSASFRPPVSSKNNNISSSYHRRRRGAAKHLNPLTRCFFSKPRITIPQNHPFLSLPLQLCNYGNKSSTLNAIVPLSDHLQVDFSVETPSEVKVLLRELGNSCESLNAIDAFQRLGIDHHYQEEIDDILLRHHAIISSGFDHETDLHKVALRFRLLRQRGYYVSADVFEVFMDKEGNFDQELTEDINGLMSLYEASQLCMKGEEDILEEAEDFTLQTLYSKTVNLNHDMAKFVHSSIARPHHKNLSTFMVKNYFGDTQWTNQWISILQQVAKSDFNETQALHQKEIVRFLQWWNESGLAEESKFARHQPLSWYAFSLAMSTDPSFSEERILVAKSISFVYLIDDIFDVYGTLTDLTLFTDAVCRWDLVATEQLPDCMKHCFSILYEITNQISYSVYQKHGYNPIKSLQKAWGDLFKAFLVEAGWFKSEYSPSAQEYLENGIISSGVPMVLVHIFFLLGQGIREETLELLDSNPDIISSSAMILRLWDDLGTAEDEGQDGHDGSYVEYYMKEHKGISFEDTRKHIENMISDAWKTLNKESLISLQQNPFPLKFVEVSLNIARTVPIVYNYGRDESFPSLEKLIKSLLFQSVDTVDTHTV